jgi:hypothetical protein
MRRLFGLGLALILVMGVAVPVGATPIAPRPFRAPLVLLLATMTGAAERPGPGDADGTGSALVLVNRMTDEICTLISVQNIVLPATASHIHVGPPTAPGPIVVPLAAPDESGFASSCVPVATVLLNNIADHPSEYYVNVHNVPFPAGAVRGQLWNPAAPGT